MDILPPNQLLAGGKWCFWIMNSFGANDANGYVSGGAVSGGGNSNNNNNTFSKATTTTTTNQSSADTASYESNIIKLGTVSSSYEFWSLYGHLKRGPDFLKERLSFQHQSESRRNRCDYFYFRSGITPAWEDKANTKGGKLSLKIKREVSPRIWEHLLLALSSGLMEGLGVCGIVWSMRIGEDIISVWNQDCGDDVAIRSIKEILLSTLQLPSNLPSEYKSHFKNNK